MASEFTMHFDTNNESFDADVESEMVRILRAVADQMEHESWTAGHSKTIFDADGEDVGRWRWSIL